MEPFPAVPGFCKQPNLFVGTIIYTLDAGSLMQIMPVHKMKIHIIHTTKRLINWKKHFNAPICLGTDIVALCSNKTLS